MAQFKKTVANYQDIEKISFQEATVPEIGVIHKPMELGKLEFDNPLTTSDCIFTYNITVKAGYDLKDIKDDGGNELTQTITVTLPKATVYEPYVDEDSFTKHWDDEKITANIGLDDIHDKKLEMIEHAKEAAIEGGLYEKTADHAKVVITDYLMRRRNTMNKVIVVKAYALRGIHELSQNPQKYIFKLKKAKLVAIIACDAGVRIISVMAR